MGGLFLLGPDHFKSNLMWLVLVSHTDCLNGSLLLVLSLITSGFNLFRGLTCNILVVLISACVIAETLPTNFY